MIIDSKAYNGVCECGHEHNMVTELCIIESGCLADFDKHVASLGITGRCAAIYDENTYRATEGKHPRADLEIILPPEGLHADEHAVGLAMPRIPKDCDYLIAVGSGTVHDTTRYCAHELGIDFISCPTAASVDGFCSSVAAMTWCGFKKTFTAVAPRLVIADLDVISAAPRFLTNSGFGDMIGKFIALADWRISHVLTGEYLCERIYKMTLDATREVMAAAEDILRGSHEAHGKLIYGLLMSGLAMQLLGNSRCASGAEHHISHLIEMQPKGLGASSDALHGEKVGVGTLMAAREYHRILAASPTFRDCPALPRERVAELFCDLADSIYTENAKICTEGITKERLEAAWSCVAEVISGIPTEAELYEKYKLLGLKASLSDIGVSESLRAKLLDYSPFVRNRLTLMRLRQCVKNPLMDGRRVILAAHRGDRKRHPENTLSAFRAALELGCDMIETDIRRTADGELVLIHDRSTLRTGEVDKNVDEMTLAQLREINVGAYHPSGEVCPVPTVRELMELIKDSDILVNWEIKIYPRDFGDEATFAVVDRLIELIDEYGLGERSMLNSFSARTLEYIKRKHGDRFPIHGQGIANCRRTYDEPSAAEEDIYDWCCLYPNERGTGKTALDYPEGFAYCAEHGIIPCICITDELEAYRTAIDLGCRMFTSNDVVACDEILRELGVR